MNAARRDFHKVGAGADAVMSGVSAKLNEVSSSTASRERTSAPAGARA
jgi:hypothetical protein